MNDNDGEKELVLGNKQLLAIFFVGTLLCGVFFAMGYVVGGNSAKAVVAAADSTPAPVSEGKRDEPRPQPETVPASTAATSAPTPLSPDSGGSMPGAEPKVTDNPAAAGAQPLAAAPAPVQATKPAAPVPEPVSTGVFLTDPEKGANYLQVAAVGRPDADVVVKQLRERELPAILAPGTKPGQYRVLVGPYRSNLTLADAKIKLKALGFNDVFTQKP